MCRAIKFRVYIKPLKRYAKGYETILYHHQCNMKPTWTVNVSPEEYYGDEDLIIEQDTGFKDQNGKKIHEGDIVKFGDSIAVIIWRDERAEFGVRWTDCGIEDSLGWQLETEKTPSEIIGNIHESNMEENDDRESR